MQRKALSTACELTQFTLEIDDFRIWKGPDSNTGFHDLRNGNLLTLVIGINCQALVQNQRLMNLLKELKSYAVVMGLIRFYHKFVAEFFPEAIWVAERFYVNRYLVDALKKCLLIGKN